MTKSNTARRVPANVGALAGFLIAMGVLHFLAPRQFDAIMPRALPESTHRPLTYVSGAAEVAAGALLLIPRTRSFGARFTILLLLAILPANVDVALRGGYRGLPGWLATPAAAWLRVPLQIPLMLWAWAIHRSAPPAR